MNELIRQFFYGKYRTICEDKEAIKLEKYIVEIVKKKARADGIRYMNEYKKHVDIDKYVESIGTSLWWAKNVVNVCEKLNEEMADLIYRIALDTIRTTFTQTWRDSIGEQ